MHLDALTTWLDLGCPVFFFFVFFVFFVFSVCSETVCFGCFSSIPKQRVSIKQKTHPNSLKDSIYRNFSENLGLFRFVSVSYETDLFVSVVSIKVRKTETNRNIFFLVSRNKPKQTQNRSCFGLFRFEPKFFFVCFGDTLTRGRQFVNFSWYKYIHLYLHILYIYAEIGKREPARCQSFFSKAAPIVGCRDF